MIEVSCLHKLVGLAATTQMTQGCVFAAKPQTHTESSKKEF
jgi:transcriptional antiterminator Rof (Rho-off)